MAGVKELRRLSQEGAPADVGGDLPSSDLGTSVVVAPSGEQYTDDGGRVLGLGWVEYYDASSGANFYANDEKGLTEWTYPEELLSEPEFVDPTTGESAVLFPPIGPAASEGKNVALSPLLSERSTPVSSGRNDNNLLPTEKSPGPLALFNSRRSAFGDDEDTEGSSDDEDDNRGARLGGGFRNPRPLGNEEEPEEEEEVKTSLNAASQAMLDKLNNTRAGQSGALMENQAAFKKDGMLMLDSIANKDDPTTEKADDEETIKRLQNERVKMQEEMEKVRSSFSEVELFKLREEFNEVDADRSGYIDDEELKMLLTLLNDSKVPSESEVRRIMLSADSSGDGQLDFLEFLALVKALKEERKANNSFTKKMAKLADTVKADVLGSVMSDLEEYKTRAYRFWNKDKVEKRERREIEKQRVRAENEAKKAQEEADRKALADIDALQAKKAEEREEVTGLETKVLYKGNDEDFPDEDDMVTIHVKMTMVAQKEGEKNEVLENSRKRRRPFRFKVSGGAVIPGLALSIPKMSLGTSIRVTCPPELAYGDQGLPPKVPPNTTLILDIELLSFQAAGGVDA